MDAWGWDELQPWLAAEAVLRSSVRAPALDHLAPTRPAVEHAEQRTDGKLDLQGIDNAEIIEIVHARRQPLIPVSTSVPR